MRAFLSFAAVAATLLSHVAAAPAAGQSSRQFGTPVHPGGKSDIVITYKNTVNSTTAMSNTTHHPNTPDSGQGTQQLPLSFVNNFSGGSINAYITGQDPTGAVVFVKADGTFFHPALGSDPSTPAPITDDIAIPLGAQGSTTSVTLPDYISAARIWFAEGELKFFVVKDGNGNPAIVEPSPNNAADPSAGVNWGFVELTNNSEQLYANISYVDFVGLILGMTMTTTNGSTQSAPGLQSGAVASICNDLKAQAAKDSQPWDKLCQVDGSGNPLRVTAPFDYMQGNSDFSTYYDSYVSQVWSKYSSQALNIDPQNGSPMISCQVSGDTMSCAGDNQTFAKPVSADIFGCNSGPFANDPSTASATHLAVVPRLCAAFVRSTLLLDGGDTQPSLPDTSYYTTDPTDHYSAIVHKYENGGKGYAFPYDDVIPNGGSDTSGAVHDGSPKDLTIYVGGGGPSS